MSHLSVSDAARYIGHKSRSQLYRLMNSGRLDSHVRHQGGRRVLESIVLAEAVQNATQQRMTSIQIVQGNDAPNWIEVARVCNSYLDPTHWAPPPWSEQKWRTLFISLRDALAGCPAAIECDELD